MKKIIVRTSRCISCILLLVSLLASCQKDDSEENAMKSIVAPISGKIEGIEPEDCYVSTIAGETRLSDADFTIQSNINRCVQTFVVRDEKDNVRLLWRGLLKKGQRITIDTQTTTIALVTQHPLFAAIKGDDLQFVTKLIVNSPYYQSLYGEVESAIKSQRNIYDENNEALLLAFSNLFEDICGNIDDERYDDNLDIISDTLGTRAIYENPKIYPLHAEINGNKLTLRNTGLTPSYYGTVQCAAGNTVNISVPSRSDYGGLDIFKTVGEINLGPKVDFRFGQQGEYQFHLSRMGAVATVDFYLRIAHCVLDIIGLNLDEDDAVQAIAKAIGSAITNAGSNVNDAITDPMVWFGIAYDATLQQLKTGTFFKHGVSESLAFTSKFLSGSLNWYGKVKGIGNALTRLGFALSAPEELDFCLCYYDNKISTCTEARLTKISGDDQTGYAKQRLLLPLNVYVTVLGDDGLPQETSAYHRVRFDVVSGGGKVESDLVSTDHENQASTYWTLGESGEQKVKATVVDMITDKEISEPVYFTATLDKAQITIRLDWSKHSGDTDIDLHVIDPYGERIYFNHMTSASKGYLDRDDTVGPGPEHVRWENAPVGTYKIYVHYYPNNNPDKSVTSYKVSVIADGITYQPKTGSIAYDQMVPVGQFAVGRNSTRSESVISVIPPDSICDWVVPKK